MSQLKKRLWRRYFPVNFAKFLRTPFYRTPSNNCFWLQTFRPATLVKRYSDTGVFLWILRSFYKHLSRELAALHFLISVLPLPDAAIWKVFLEKAVSKFQKFSVGFQHATLTLLENKTLHKYFSRFLSTFLEHLFRWQLGHCLGL